MRLRGELDGGEHATAGGDSEVERDGAEILSVSRARETPGS